MSGLVRPKMLDLYCGAGGVGKGYFLAGYDVEGVDIAPQPRYPFRFHQADALEFLLAHGHEFDAIHASPPCQGYSRMRHLPWLKDRQYPLLIDATRQALIEIGKPWVIENVEDAPMLNGITLCGVMFGLKVYRHRKFESSELLLAPPHLKHPAVTNHGRMLNDRAKPNADGWVSLPSKATGSVNRWNETQIGVGHGSWSRDQAAEAMGIDWMTKKEIAQAIPPAYTEYIGRQLLPAVQELAS